MLTHRRRLLHLLSSPLKEAHACKDSGGVFFTPEKHKYGDAGVAEVRERADRAPMRNQPIAVKPSVALETRGSEKFLRRKKALLAPRTEETEAGSLCPASLSASSRLPDGRGGLINHAAANEASSLIPGASAARSETADTLHRGEGSNEPSKSGKEYQTEGAAGGQLPRPLQQESKSWPSSLAPPRLRTPPACVTSVTFIEITPLSSRELVLYFRLSQIRRGAYSLLKCRHGASAEEAAGFGSLLPDWIAQIFFLGRG